MDILFLSAFPDSYYQTVTSLNPKEVSPAAQKYNHLLLKGLQENGANVTVLCTRDPLSKLEKKERNNAFTMKEDGILYEIAPYHQSRLQNHRRASSWLKQMMHSYYTSHPGAYLILDYLAPLAKEAASLALGYSVIVTDLPESIYVRGNALRKKYYIQRSYQIINRAQSSILLSGLMKEKLSESQPFLVLEGIVDSHREITAVQKKPYILYAGAISKECGIDRLATAFSQIHTDYELHLYGNGNYADELKRFSSDHAHIMYGGMIDNRTVLRYEQEASLLVNPRPVNSTFSRYSFPSKNLEYMSSGTPLLTTKLQSMPAEYVPYVYLFPDDTVEGIRTGLEQALNDLPVHGTELGRKAHTFVMHEKAENVQAKKVLELIEGNADR
ncbi:MAG: glycosyltransferase family 4 protein [Erysipelotrichaceae bacterium]|nr:glycosyltransferase family 4 protein [Erysipelotrichaceae bacterium]